MTNSISILSQNTYIVELQTFVKHTPEAVSF